VQIAYATTITIPSIPYTEYPTSELAPPVDVEEAAPPVPVEFPELDVVPVAVNPGHVRFLNSVAESSTDPFALATNSCVRCVQLWNVSRLQPYAVSIPTRE
jgi:hypothetical protein